MTWLVLTMLVELLANLPSCFTHRPFQEVYALNWGNCHLHIISWPSAWAQFPAESLDTVHGTLNAVLSIKIYQSLKNGSVPFRRTHQNAYDVFNHRRLSLLYYYYTKASDLPQLHMPSRLLQEPEIVFRAIRIIHIYTFHSESDASNVYGNILNERKRLIKHPSCRDVSPFDVDKVVPHLINRELTCLQINMKGLLSNPSRPISVATDVPKKYFQTEANNIWKVNPVKKGQDHFTAMLSLSGCGLKVVGKSYNLTYVHTKKPLTLNGETTEFVGAKITLRTRAIITPDSRNLKLLESPFLYKPLAFVTIEDNLDGLENALIGAIDFKMWALLVIVFVCMRISVVTFLSIIDNHCTFMHLLVSFLASGTYRKLRSHRATWKSSKCLLVNKLIWALGMSTLVSCAYKAGLASFLTRTPEPMYIKDLETLISRCNRQAHCVYVFDGTFGAARRVSEISSSLREVMRVMDSKKIISNFIKAQLESVHRTGYGAKELTTIPIALLHTRNLAEFARESLNLFIPEKKVSPTISLNFNIFTPFYVSRSYFYRIMKKGLSSVRESGLYDHWQRYIDTKMAMHLLNTIHRELTALFPTILFQNEKEKWLMYILCERCKPQSARRKALSFTDLSSISIVYSILMESICGVLVFEIYSN